MENNVMWVFFLFYLFCAALIVDWKGGAGWHQLGAAGLIGLFALGGAT
jgi:hypothetical protein